MALTELVRKADLLESGGYTYNLDRELYINRKAKKAFSVDFLEEKALSEVECCMREETGAKEWKFYFTDGPSPGVRRELERILG
jgi:hypothetical protein